MWDNTLRSFWHLSDVTHLELEDKGVLLLKQVSRVYFWPENGHSSNSVPTAALLAADSEWVDVKRCQAEVLGVFLFLEASLKSEAERSISQSNCGYTAEVLADHVVRQGMTKRDVKLISTILYYQTLWSYYDANLNKISPDRSVRESGWIWCVQYLCGWHWLLFLLHGDFPFSI